MKGNLIIIGGAEDKHGKSTILKHVINEIGGTDARLVIMTTASEKPGMMGNEYAAAFRRLGLTNIEILDIMSRDEANNEEYSKMLKQSTGVYFTGGDQLRITSILGGTAIYNAIHESFRDGTVFIGTSAGASAMSSTMIVDGNDNQPARKCTLKMAPGLGLLEEAVVDQHFDQRGRIGRLLCSVAQNPHILGIGIDEDTAVKVTPDARFSVIGTNAVTVVDGTGIADSNVSELKPDEILAITNIRMHILPHGHGFDMRSRNVIKAHQ